MYEPGGPNPPVTPRAHAALDATIGYTLRVRCPRWSRLALRIVAAAKMLGFYTALNPGRAAAAALPDKVGRRRKKFRPCPPSRLGCALALAEAAALMANFAWPWHLKGLLRQPFVSRFWLR